MNALKTILVTVDFSAGSRSALEQAARLAERNAAKLHILHVVDTSAVVTLADSRNVSFEYQAATATEGAREALTRWLEQSGMPAGCEITIVVGVPLHEILEHTRILQPDLLVAGITGSGDSKVGAGNLACKLARKAQTKILLAKANHPNAFHRIVACIDFSDTSREVVAQAHRLAVQDGARVDFFHVWQEPWLKLPYAYAVSLTVPAEFDEKYQQLLRASLKEFVSEAVRDIESSEVLVSATNYANGIATHAMEADADLIVIGAKGRTNLRYVLLGSTVEHLLTNLPCSLLVVKLPVE